MLGLSLCLSACCLASIIVAVFLPCLSKVGLGGKKNHNNHHAPVCHHAQTWVSGRDACFAERQRGFSCSELHPAQRRVVFFRGKKTPLLPAQCFPPLKKILCLENKGSINTYLNKKRVCVCLRSSNSLQGGTGEKIESLGLAGCKEPA